MRTKLSRKRSKMIVKKGHSLQMRKWAYLALLLSVIFAFLGFLGTSSEAAAALARAAFIAALVVFAVFWMLTK